MAAVTASMVKELRERTGLGMMECKKALVAAEGDIERAIDDLRKSGQAKAAKKAGRTAAEGVVMAGPGRGLYIRRLRRQEALDHIEVLQALIELAARLACTRCKYEPSRGRLREAHARLAASLARGDSQLRSIERTRFYEVLFEVAGNPELARLHPAITGQILRAQVYPFLTAEDRNSQYADYAPLCQAILDGDVRAAVRIVGSHLGRSRKHALHLPDAAFDSAAVL